MTDALATAILGKLTSWYDFEGDLTDAHGSNNLTADVLSGFEPGKVGLSLKKGTRASANLSPIPISAGSGQFTIGGWFNYSQAVPEVNSFGLTTDTSVAQNEAFYVDNHAAGGNFALFGFTTAGVSWRVEDPNKPSIRYPITVQAVDSDGRIAQSPQHIDIAANSGLTPGWYFVVGTFDNGLVKLYLNAALRTIGNASGTLKTPVVLVQIANRFTNTVSDAGLDSCFFSENAVMTIDEVAWLYNNGAGRNYAALQAASA